MFIDTKVSEAEIRSFYEATRRAEYLLASRNPNLIVAPLRGAEPLIESMRIIAKLNGRELPEVVYVETGTIDHICEDGERSEPKALSSEQKMELVGSRLQPHLEGQDCVHLCLVDEVENGGSIVKNLDYVNGTLRILNPDIQFDLWALGICGPKEKARKFDKLLGMGKLFPIHVIDLFTIDRTRYLSPLVRKNGNVTQTGEYPRDIKTDLYAEIGKLHIKYLGNK